MYQIVANSYTITDMSGFFHYQRMIHTGIAYIFIMKSYDICFYLAIVSPGRLDLGDDGGKSGGADVIQGEFGAESGERLSACAPDVTSCS